MKRSKILGFTVMVVLALTAVASASASAAECPGTGEGVALCSSGHVLEGTTAFTGSEEAGSGVQLQQTGGPRYVCWGGTSSGQFVGTLASVKVKGLILKWTHCSVTNAETTCQMKPLVLDGAQGTGTGPGLTGKLNSTGELTLGGFGQQLSTVYVEGKAGKTCLLAGEYPLRGQIGCTVPSGTVEAVTHKEHCGVSPNTAVTLNQKPASFQFSEEVKLASGLEFSFQKA